MKGDRRPAFVPGGSSTRRKPRRRCPLAGFLAGEDMTDGMANRL